MSEPPAELLRIVDACVNRAAEGLRTTEDFVRFALDCRYLSEEIKTLRHRLVRTVEESVWSKRAWMRDAVRDVGRQVSVPSESVRNSEVALVRANLARTQQALRTLEETAKLSNIDHAEWEALRYAVYAMESAVLNSISGHQSLSQHRLYVLTEDADLPDFEAKIKAILSASQELQFPLVIQLREKKSSDRVMLSRCRQLREWTANTDVRFIVNDRPDLAKLSHADGVHLGQDDLDVSSARRILGPEKLIGVSTHSLAQAKQAVVDGANYLGSGPTFPSKTKQFDEFAGIQLARQITTEINLPTFAIGGIDLQNMAQVLNTQVHGIAVCHTVWHAANIGNAIQSIARQFTDSNSIV
ncbi:MAG: thiamine phosphate synthase [Pirellulaceae bacterium]